MIGLVSKSASILTIALMIAISLPVNGQQQGGNEILTGDVVDEEPAQQEGLRNPRIVIPENLEEMSEVRVVGPELESDSLEAGRQSGSPDTTSQNKSDGRTDLSMHQLTYIQKNVPFFTKRNMVFFGRVELDYAHYSSGVLEGDSRLDVRRLRAGLAGHTKFWSGLNYKFEVDLTDDENTLSDAYLSWQSSNWGRLRIGNQKVAQTLSGQTSSVSIPFMERPLPVLAFTLKRRLGIGWDMHRNKVGANVTLFGIDPNEKIGSHGWAARGYFNPSIGRFHALHIGTSFMQLAHDGDSQIRARPESHVTDIRLVDTGIWPAVKTGSALGIELAGKMGPVTFRSEYYRTDWNRENDSSPRFNGWYAEISWFPTGETTQYREGKFIRPNIKSDRGAWELALRFSNLDLNDRDVEGGEEDNLAIGVNWYSRTHWRFMTNLIKVKSVGPYGEQNPWIGQFRTQYFF